MVTPASNVQPVGMTASASSTHRPVTEAELVLVPEIDIEEILVHVEAVIPDIDLDAARRTVTAMNPIPSTNDIVTHFLDQGYTKKSKKSFSTDSDRHSSLKRSWSETIDDIPKFLGSYSDPVSYFSDNQRKQSESYINHAKAFLLRAFPTTDKSILEQALQEENFHFLPTIRKLETRMGLRTNAFLQRSTIRRSLDMMGTRDLFFTIDILGLCVCRSFSRWCRSTTVGIVVDQEQQIRLCHSTPAVRRVLRRTALREE